MGSLTLRDRQVGSGEAQEKAESGGALPQDERHYHHPSWDSPAVGSPQRREGGKGQAGGGAEGRARCRAGSALLPPPAEPLLHPGVAAVTAGPMVAAGQRRRRWGVPVLLAAYVGYLGLGAAVLQALERPAEVQAAEHLLREHWELLANHTCLQGPALQRLIEVSPGAELSTRGAGAASDPGGESGAGAAAAAPPALEQLRKISVKNLQTFSLCECMRTHHPVPQKPPTAWEKLSAGSSLGLRAGREALSVSAAVPRTAALAGLERRRPDPRVAVAECPVT